MYVRMTTSCESRLWTPRIERQHIQFGFVERHLGGQRDEQTPARWQASFWSVPTGQLWACWMPNDGSEQKNPTATVLLYAPTCKQAAHASLAPAVLLHAARALFRHRLVSAGLFPCFPFTRDTIRSKGKVEPVRSSPGPLAKPHLLLVDTCSNQLNER